MKIEKTKDPLIRTDLLLKQEEFRGFQPDFAKAILSKPSYIKAEALKLLNKELRKG